MEKPSRKLLLSGLICLTIGCALFSPAPRSNVPQGAASGPVVVPTGAVAESNPTFKPSPEQFPTSTSPAAAPTPSNTVSVEGGAQDTVTPDLADFPTTILYQSFGGGGPGMNCEQEMAKSPRGLIADTFDGWPTNLHVLGICIWGMPLKKTMSIAVASPDASRLFSATFTTVGNIGRYYDVKIFGINLVIDDYVYLGPDGKAEIDLYLWWPDGFSDGDWPIVVTGDKLRVDGKFHLVKPKHAWVSLQSFDNKLHPMFNSCEVLPSEMHTRPLQVTGGGFTPKKDVQLALYHQNDIKSDYERLDSYSIQADDNGRIEFELQKDRLGPIGYYRLIGLTEKTRIFFQESNLNGLVEAYDCFYLP